MKFTKKPLSSLLLIVITLISVNTSFAKEKLDKIVATVNGDAITKTELNNMYNLILSRMDGNSQLPPKNILEIQILNKIITDKLQTQLAKKHDLTISSSKINQAIKEFARDEKLTVQELKNNLKKINVPFSTFRNNLKNELLITELQQREIGLDTNITESEVSSFINSPIGQNLTGIEYNIGHILIPFPEKASPNKIKQINTNAKKIVQNLKSGANFNKIAIAKSKSQTALNAGDLGWRTIGEIPNLFVNYVTSMKVGEIQGPIKSSSGLHIIKLKEKRAGQEKLFEEIHIRQILLTPNEKLSDDEAKKQIIKLREKIIKGADFVKIAQTRSNELSSANRGGDLGWINKNSVFPEFYNNLKSLKINEISPPFKTKMGWHIVQILEKRSNNHSLQAARNKARAILYNKKFHERLEIWLKKLKANAKIENFLVTDPA